MGMNILSFNIPALGAYNNSQKAMSDLTYAMQQLSSGKSLLIPGSSPSDYAVATGYEYQIKNTAQSIGNIQNAINMLYTADGWLQQTQDMISRMGQLSVGAIDSSKTQEDRESLDLEYQQLKKQISMIAAQSEYNSVLIAGRSQALTYDYVEQTFTFSKLNGEQNYTLPHKFISGVVSTNGLDLNFNPNKDYILSPDGQYILYVDNDENLARYNVETGALSVDSSSSTIPKTIKIGNDGSVWYSQANTPPSVVTGTTQSLNNTNNNLWTIHKMDLNAWSEDTDWGSVNKITNVINGEFSYYEDRFIYATPAEANTEKTNLVSVYVNDPTEEFILFEGIATEKEVLSEDSGTLSAIFQANNIPLLKGSLSISDGTDTIVDNGLGKLVDDFDDTIVGTIDYSTGEYNYDYNFTGTEIIATYDTQLYNPNNYTTRLINQGFTDGSESYNVDLSSKPTVGSEGNTENVLPIVEGSIVVTAGSVTLLDDGQGNLIDSSTGKVAGTITSYVTGSFSINFDEPEEGKLLQIEYQYAGGNTKTSISQDGQFVATLFSSSNGNLNSVKVTNINTGAFSVLSLEPDANLNHIDISRDALQVFVHDKASNSIRSLDLNPSAKPQLSNVQTIKKGMGGVTSGDAAIILAENAVQTIQLSSSPIIPSTIEIETILSSTETTITDDGEGKLTDGTNTYGTIDYHTGEIFITFETLPETYVSNGSEVSLEETGEITINFSKASFNNLSVEGGSNRSTLNVHTGAGPQQISNLILGDVSLVSLGLSLTGVSTISAAEEALGKTEEAIDQLSIQRSTISGEVSSLVSQLNSQSIYKDNIARAEAMITEVDFAKTASEISTSKVWYQTTLEMISKANRLPELIVQLLYRR